MSETQVATIVGYTLKDADRRIRSYPQTTAQLVECCKAHASIAENQFLAPGLFFAEHDKNSSIFPINGQYGVLLALPRANEIVAAAGFNVIDDKMIINHTPQGHSPDFATPDQKRFFSSPGGRNFRHTMMNTLVNIGRSLRLHEITGSSAINHLHSRSSDFPMDRATKVIDEVFVGAGFVRDVDGNFLLSL